MTTIDPVFEEEYLPFERPGEDDGLPDIESEDEED